MIKHQKKLIPAAMLMALSLLARSAGAATIPTTYDQYTIFAEGNLTVGVTSGTGTHVGGTIGAIGDVTIGDNVQISDVGDTWGGSVFGDDDLLIGDYSYIMGRVLADNTNATGGGPHGVVIGDYSRVDGRVDAGGGHGSKGDISIGNWSTTGGTAHAAAAITLGTNVDIGSSTNSQGLQAGGTVTIGTGTDVWGNVTYAKNPFTNNGWVQGAITKGTPIAPDNFTYTTRTAPTFDRLGTGGDQDITSDAELAPGTYNNLVVRSGVTLTVYYDTPASDGTYDFRNITMESGASISIRSDSGAADVIIQAFEDLLSNGNNVLGRPDQPSLILNIGNHATIGSGSTIAAHLLTYSDITASTITINADSTVLGKVYSAGDVIVYDNVVVPEPGTLALLGLGATCLLAKRRRGNRA